MATITNPSSIPAEWDRNLTTRAERYAAGKALRSSVPRSRGNGCMVGAQVLSLEEICDVFESILGSDVITLCCVRCILTKEN